MKKLLCILVALIMALTCLTGCNKGIHNDEETKGEISDKYTSKDMSLTDVTETVGKLKNEGMGIEIGMALSLKPVFDESFTKEMFEQVFGSMFTQKSDGSYEAALTVKGEVVGDDLRMEFLLGNELITDIIIVGDTGYMNVRKLYESIINILAPLMGAADTDAMTWPFEHDYMAISDITEMSDVTDSDSMLAEEDLETLMIIMAIVDALPADKIESLVSELEKAAVSAKVLTSSGNKIEIKLNSNNVKPMALEIIELLRKMLPDLMESAIPGLKNSAVLPEDFKQYLDTFDKAEFQSQLDESFNKETFEADADELAQAFKGVDINLALEAGDTSCKITLEMIMSDVDSESISDMSIKLSLAIDEKNVDDIKAPSSILTEEEAAQLAALSQMSGADTEL